MAPKPRRSSSNDKSNSFQYNDLRKFFIEKGCDIKRELQ
jgi:hypothetical protein